MLKKREKSSSRRPLRSSCTDGSRDATATLDLLLHVLQRLDDLQELGVDEGDRDIVRVLEDVHRRREGLQHSQDLRQQLVVVQRQAAVGSA